MTLTALGISASPRANGNSDLLVREALRGCEEAGAQTEFLRLGDYRIGACTECNTCQKTGVCVLQDDYQGILDRLLEVDRLVFATPVFFMAVSAQAKLFIDRGQALWARKHLLHLPLFQPRRDRRAMVVAVGGSRSTRQFDGIRRTMQSYFECVEIAYVSTLFVNQVDAAGAVRRHATALPEAFRLGAALADAASPAQRATQVELFG
ncbi:MAG: flavodoxin family protein [Sedimentisphaerales bacterium]|nr:flavodoxin family protein [Sedimentisphaerales bacterium]